MSHPRVISSFITWRKVPPARCAVSESTNQPFFYHFNVTGPRGKSTVILQPTVEHIEHREGHRATYGIVVIIVSKVAKCNTTYTLSSMKMWFLYFFLSMSCQITGAILYSRASYMAGNMVPTGRIEIGVSGGDHL